MQLKGLGCPHMGCVKQLRGLAPSKGCHHGPSASEGRRAMTRAGTTSLSYEVFVAPPELTALNDLRPGGQFLAWSPISATLIMGERDAVLVDPLLTRTQAHALAHWVAASGKNLTAVYVTHGHGDHFFGLGTILDRFPEARGLATPAVVEYMRSQVQPDAVGSFWEPLF